MLFLFEDYALDTDRRELLRADRPIALQPQVFDILAFLIRNRGRVVAKDELIDAVWGGRVVSESTLTSRINAARSAVGDSGEAQRLIRTASRKGFRFIGAVQETPSSEAPTQRPPIEAWPLAAALAPDGKTPRLSIVVLPFANLGGNPDHEPFVDGVTESLTTDLSRIRGSFVIARHTAFAYKGKAIDLKQRGRELGVHYVLEGSILRSGERMRINAQLADAETGAHVWAERFDKPVADLAVKAMSADSKGRPSSRPRRSATNRCGTSSLVLYANQFLSRGIVLSRRPRQFLQAASNGFPNVKSDTRLQPPLAVA
jgi:TolB-like protein